MIRKFAISLIFILGASTVLTSKIFSELECTSLNKPGLIVASASTDSDLSPVNEKVSFRCLNENVLSIIATYLRWSERNSSLGGLNRFTRKLFSGPNPKYPFRNELARLYSLPEMTQFSTDADLFWFVQPSTIPYEDRFRSHHFIVSLVTALTVNQYFPHNGVLISQLILTVILSASAEDQLDLLNQHIRTLNSDAATISVLLGRYFAKTSQNESLFTLSTLFPGLLQDSLQTYEEMFKFLAFLETLQVEDYIEMLTSEIELFFDKAILILPFNVFLFSSLNSSPKRHLFTLLFSLKNEQVLTFIINRFGNDLKFQYHFIRHFIKFCIDPHPAFDSSLKTTIFNRNIVIFNLLETFVRTSSRDITIHFQHLKDLNTIRFGSQDLTTVSLHPVSSIIAAYHADKEVTFKSALSAYVNSDSEIPINEFKHALFSFFKTPKYAGIAVALSITSHKSLLFYLNALLYSNADIEIIEKIIIYGLDFPSMDSFFLSLSTQRFPNLLPLMLAFNLNIKYLLNRFTFKNLLLNFYDKSDALRIILNSAHISTDDAKFVIYLKIFLKALRKSNRNNIRNPKVETNHLVIIKLYKYKYLHQIFKRFSIKMSTDSVLAVIRSNDLYAEFQNFFHQYGILICTEFPVELFRYLRPNYEFKLFDNLFDANQYSTNRFTCSDLRLLPVASQLPIQSFLTELIRRYCHNGCSYAYNSVFIYWFLTYSPSVTRICWKLSDNNLIFISLDIPEYLKLSFYDLYSQRNLSKRDRINLKAKFRYVFGEDPEEPVLNDSSVSCLLSLSFSRRL